LLLRILPRRFGPLPDEIAERVYKADPTTIETWSDRVLDAESLEDVFSKQLVAKSKATAGKCRLIPALACLGAVDIHS